MAHPIMTITKVERYSTSALGNPTYRVMFSDGTSYLTVVDGSIGYYISNSEYHGVPVEVVFNPMRNRVVIVNICT